MYATFQEISNTDFEEVAIQLFEIHATHNPIYRKYLELISFQVNNCTSIDKIPFLPISMFKHHRVVLENSSIEEIFRSSGTTGQIRSQHFIHSIQWYYESCFSGFKRIIDCPQDYCYIVTLPTYENRSDASLIFMVKYLMEQSNFSKHCGFYLQQYEEMQKKIEWLQAQDIPTIIFGVTFSLIDFSISETDCSAIIIIETGGMKGRREEISKETLFDLLYRRLRPQKIYSEYGMTELQSQAYAEYDQLFSPAPTMKVFPRNISDPLSSQEYGKRCAINIVDLANQYSCPFIATDDVGIVYENGTFRILGRLDNSELRGCQLMTDFE